MKKQQEEDKGTTTAHALDVHRAFQIAIQYFLI